MNKYIKINEKYDIYRISDVNDTAPESTCINGKEYKRFMNFLYIPDYVYNLDEDYVTTVNDIRYEYRDIVIDYEYNTEVIQRVIEMIPYEYNDKEIKILDFGCGEGGAEQMLREAFPKMQLFGVDIREIDLELLSKYYHFKKVNLNKEIPYSDCYFDAIVALFVFHFKVTDIQIESLYNILKKDGLLCFNLIKSADRGIVKRLLNIGFKMERKIEYTFKKGRLVECYAFRK